MKGLKANYGFYISVGVLGLAVVGSGFFYKRETDKAKSLKASVAEWRENLSAVQLGIPTEEHREDLEQQKEQIQETYKKILSEALRWYYAPQKMTGLDFQGNRLTTIRLIEIAAKQQNILIQPKAAHMGFEEYKTMPPGLDDDVLQLQREFSAAVDIVQLLIASNVYSIDRLARGDSARMEEGASTARLAYGMEDITAARRRKSKFDFYTTVPFRVEFTCTYPSLAFFQKSLLTPGRVDMGNERIPRNFLVVNDLRFRVQDIREQGPGALMELEKTRAATFTMATVTGTVTEEIPEDLPNAEIWVTRNPQHARLFFKQWRAYSPQEKEIYRIDLKLLQQIPEEQKAQLRARRERMRQELEYRKLAGRGPEYSIIEVNMLIDFVQFNEKLLEELEGKPPKTKLAASSLSTARR